MSALPQLILAAAWAADEAVTTVGADALWTGSLAEGDADVMFGERARFDLGARGGLDWSARVDGRWNLDPSGDERWEASRLRAFGVRAESPAWTVDVGRAVIEGGGPRLIDGIQARHHRGAWTWGGWLGEAPDLYTGRPAARFGGGPLIGWSSRALRVTGLGEVLFAADGLDRAALRVEATLSNPPDVELSARLDAQVAGPDGVPSLPEAALDARLRPTDAVRLHAGYLGYTTWRNLRSSSTDPDVRRFADRIADLGLQEPVILDELDPRMYHLFLADARWSRGLGWVASGGARFRWHPDAEFRYLRAQASVGWLGGRWEARGEAAAWVRDGEARGELGLTGWLEPLEATPLAVDGGAWLTVDATSPLSSPPGGYADLFVSWLAPAHLDLSAGGCVQSYPGIVRDVGVGGFIRLSHRYRGEADPRSGDPETMRLP